MECKDHNESRNSERYPYGDLFLDFKNNKYASLYEMYANFQESYYDKPSHPIFTHIELSGLASITHIDCSHQKASIQIGSVTVRVEFETDDATSSDISAYCLIFHEKQYNPLTKIVH